jgi:YfiH family protein
MEVRNESVVQVAAWKELLWLRHGFSTRRGGVSTVYQSAGEQWVGDEAGREANPDGDLNLGWTKDDDPVYVTENRRRLAAAVAEAGDPVMPLITLRQVHSAVSLVVPVPVLEAVSGFVGANGRAFREADGLITRGLGVLLGIQTADCVPVLVVDSRLRAVGCFHAGWRGTASRIVEQGVGQMVREFGSRSDDLMAAIGPSIGACCYSVGEEVYRAFSEGFSYGKALFRGGAGQPLYLDLWEANRRQLVDAGVPASRITVMRECSGCAGLPGRRRYFSHRCEGGFTGRMMSVIGVAQVS